MFDHIPYLNRGEPQSTSPYFIIRSALLLVPQHSIDLKPFNIPERTARCITKMNEQDEELGSKLRIENEPRHKVCESVVHCHPAGEYSMAVIKKGREMEKGPNAKEEGRWRADAEGIM